MGVPARGGGGGTFVGKNNVWRSRDFRPPATTFSVWDVQYACVSSGLKSQPWFAKPLAERGHRDTTVCEGLWPYECTSVSPNAARTLHTMRHAPYTARSGTLSLIASQVGRTRSITLSQTIPAASASAASVPSPERATPADDGKRRGDEDSAVLAVRDSLADKVREAAAIAAASLAQATSAAAHGPALGGGGSMEGRWDEETFLLPLPEGDGDTLLAAHAGGGEKSDDGDDLHTEKDGSSAFRLPGLAEGRGGEECDAAGTESSSVSADDGVHLRVEIWQGKHCHGQVDCVFVGKASALADHYNNLVRGPS